MSKARNQVVKAAHSYVRHMRPPREVREFAQEAFKAGAAWAANKTIHAARLIVDEAGVTETFEPINAELSNERLA